MSSTTNPSWRKRQKPKAKPANSSMASPVKRRNKTSRALSSCWRAIGWSGYALLGWLAAVWLSWLLLAQVNFLYPLWYDVLDLDAVIAHYGPENRYRAGFELTTRAERERLFSAIVTAIHADGAGLDELVYHDSAGQPLDTLLTPPEIQHLHDVARLVAVLLPVGMVSGIAVVLLLLVTLARRAAPPVLSTVFGGLLAVLSLTVAGVLLYGPTQVFYHLHEQVFPPGHQWFFYYQDSLMTLMMKAPDLFGYIALVLVALSLLGLGIVLVLSRWLLQWRTP